MNQILQYLPTSRVIFANPLQRMTKKRVFEEASLLFQMSGVPHTTVFESLFARERLGNNTLGKGVALPHCRLPNITKPIAALILLSRPIHIDPEPIDTKPIDLFFFLVVPESDDDEAYIPLLRECIRMLQTKTLCDELRAAANPVEVCASILNWVPPSALISENKSDALAKEWEALNEEVDAALADDSDTEPAVAAVENDTTEE